MFINNILLGVKNKQKKCHPSFPQSPALFSHPIFTFLYVHNLICQQHWCEKWLASSIAVWDISTQSGFQNETFRRKTRIAATDEF